MKMICKLLKSFEAPEIKITTNMKALEYSRKMRQLEIPSSIIRDYIRIENEKFFDNRVYSIYHAIDECLETDKRGMEAFEYIDEKATELEHKAWAEITSRGPFTTNSLLD